MRPLRSVSLLLVIALALAGCVTPQQSTDDEGDARTFRVEVPANATHVRIVATAEALAGEPDVTILVEDADGDNIEDATFSVQGNTTHEVRVGVSAPETLHVTVRVVDGEASLDVAISALVPGEPDHVIVREVVVIVAQAPAPTPATATPTPSPTPDASPTPTPTPTPAATPTPTPSPSPTPTPTPSPAANETEEGTNETNATG